MDDRLKESISALMDDEANELELQRVLSHADKNELLATWKTYHRVQSVLQHEQEDYLSIDISESVSQAIAQEAPLQLNNDLTEMLETTSASTNELSSSLSASIHSSTAEQLPENRINNRRSDSRIITKISSGLAIAASLFVAIVFVLQNDVDGQLGINESLITSVSSDASMSGFQNVNVLTVSSEDSPVSKKQPKIIVEFTEEHARRFNEYLLRHAEHSVASSHAGMMPLARVASVNAVGI